MAKVKFAALGGLDERGKNLYLLEINNNIFIFDAGLKLPEREMLGIDVIIPSFSYLKANKQRIKAIFISKPSDDVFGSLPYLLKDLLRDKNLNFKINIYGSSLTKFMIEQKLKRFRINNTTNFTLNAIKKDEKIYFEDCKVFVESFDTLSSTPGSLGYAINIVNNLWTPVQKQKNQVLADETIIYTGDYIFDGKESNNFNFNISKIAKIRSNNKNNKIMLLISEATTASRKSFTAPNHKIQGSIESVIKEATGRVILACYDQDLFRITEILQAIQDSGNNRSIAIYGNTLQEVLKFAADNNISQERNNVRNFNVTFKENDLINKIKVISLNQTKGTNSVVIVTGSGERLFTKMNKIASGNDDNLELLENDTIILATPPIPGNEVAHANVLDELARSDAKVISISEKQAWSLNASYEDIKLMVNILEPKYFLPVKGLYKDFNSARMAAIEAGVLHNNALIQDNGQILVFENGNLIENYITKNTNENNQKSSNVKHVKTKINEIEVNDVFVDGIGVGDIGAVVVEERRKLMSDGVLIIGLTIDKKSKEIVSLIDAQMRGVVYLTNSDLMLKNIQGIVNNAIDKYKKSNNFNTNEIKNKIRNDLQDFVKKETGKMPMILPVINEI